MVFPRFPKRTSGPSQFTSPTSTMRAAAGHPSIRRCCVRCPTRLLGTGQQFDSDARLYLAACASCHYNSGHAPLAVRPDLALNSALHLSDPTNLLQVVLRGVGAKEGIP